ncbi:MAG: hypothetical protein R3Y32_04700 [Bacillota bacterium]
MCNFDVISSHNIGRAFIKKIASNPKTPKYPQSNAIVSESGKSETEKRLKVKYKNPESMEETSKNARNFSEIPARKLDIVISKTPMKKQTKTEIKIISNHQMNPF